jgi:phenylacetate-CoA ligase
MSNLGSIYSCLPIPLQHASCTLQGWRIRLGRFGGEFPTLRREVMLRDSWSADRLIDFRNQRLRTFVQYCASIPFYDRRFRDTGVDPASIRELDDLKRLPLLSKAEVRRAIKEFSGLRSRVGSSAIAAHTSGTTGGGLRFVTSERAVREQWATWWRYRERFGLRPGIWQAYFGGRSIVPIGQDRPPFWRWNPALSQWMFSVYHLSPQNLDSYLEELRSRQIPWLHGYPSALALLAARVLERGHPVYQPRWVTTGAESLLPQQKTLLHKAFGVIPRQHYGMAEAVANISECESGALHVDEDFAAVEFLPSPDGSGFKVVGTNFTNLLTPLLRYEIGDMVSLGRTSCECGLGGRVVQTIDGRQEDYVVLGNGARIGRLDHVFKDMLSIQQAQIYQQIPGAIIVYIVRGNDYSPDAEHTLLLELRQRLGEETKIDIQYRDALDRSGAGKLRFVVSDLPEGRLLSHAERNAG